MHNKNSTVASLIDDRELIEIFNNMVEGIITINDHGIILTFNQSAENMFGYDAEEVIGENVNILMPDPIKSNHDKFISDYIETGNAHIIGLGRNVTAVKKNGEDFPMHLSVTEYTSKKSGERWFIGSCLDITLQVKQEEQLRRSMKMEALGKFTSGISHDYNNTLGIILGYAEILSRSLKDQPKLLEHVETIRHAAKRGSDLTRKLLTFSSGKSIREEPVNINELLDEDYKMLEKTLTPNIRLILSLDKDLWLTYVDRGCLEDAIINMSINAMHAMPKGGELEFTTSNTELGTLDAQVLNIDKGDYVRLTIRDTGTGMSKDVLSNIFDPFYTTKQNHGTGLGLSQVYGFVNNAGGTIRVYSEPGQGSCFYIYLPRYLDDADVASTGDNNNNGEMLSHPSAIILVVDDEPDLNELTCTILRSNGYSVHSAANAEEALDIITNNPVDLVISDVVTPQMGGLELAHIIHHRYPNIKIQLCSGFAEIEGASNDNSLSKDVLLKPYTSKELLSHVRKILEEKP